MNRREVGLVKRIMIIQPTLLSPIFFSLQHSQMYLHLFENH